MITKKSWEEFRNTGLVLFINQILHAFGWAITYEIDDGKILDVYPARVKFRGFSEGSITKSYKNIGKYLEDNHKELFDESQN